MKFSLAIDLTRGDPSIDMREVARNTMDLVRMADEGGFEVVWAAEHHAIEMTIAPNPFQLLAWFGGETENIRLGVAVVQAPYWHPIKVAGEAGLLDLMSGGRLELGLGRGAYQREFDRMMGGMDQHKGVAYMQEMLPVLKGLVGRRPRAPRRVLVLSGLDRLPEAVAEAASAAVGRRPPSVHLRLGALAGLQHHVLGAHPPVRRGREVQAAVRGGAGPGARRGATPLPHHAPHRGLRRRRGRLAALRRGGAHLGVANSRACSGSWARSGTASPRRPTPARLDNNAEYDPETLKMNLVFGTPEQVIDKLRPYEALGVDNFLYRACSGLDWARQKESLRLFIREVMPAFRDSRHPPEAAERAAAAR